MVDILHVEIHPFFERNLVSTTDLPYARQPRTYRQSAPLPRLVLRDLRRNGGPRTYEAHLAAQDVDELRQLVDAELSDESTDRRNARIALDLEDRTSLLIFGHELGLELLGVHDHRSELEHVKRPSVPADTLLLEQDRAA